MSFAMRLLPRPCPVANVARPLLHAGHPPACRESMVRCIVGSSGPGRRRRSIRNPLRRVPGASVASPSIAAPERGPIAFGGGIGCVPCRAEPPLRRSRHRRELPGACPKVASPQFRAARRAGPRRARARQCAGRGPAPPRVPLLRHPRGRQDDARAHPRQVHQLRDRRHLEAVRRVQRLRRDRRGPVRRPAGGGRGVALEGGRDARSHGQRPVHPRPRPLQGVPHRRGAHVLGEELQRVAEDAGGAAAPREVPARDDRSAEASDHCALALPEVRSQAAAGRRHRGPTWSGSLPRSRSGSRRRRWGSWRGRRTGACAMR